MTAFWAQYAGWCPICHRAIEEGELVRYAGGGTVVHNDCEEDE